jgi:putative FmdB family regulatory protein
MPVYEYRCRACGHQFDIQQSFSDDALTVCPECSGELRKVFAPVGIAFKGSGFYKTDSRSGSSGSSSSAAGTSTSSGSSGSNGGDSGSSGSGASGGDSGASTGAGSGSTGSGSSSPSTTASGSD